MASLTPEAKSNRRAMGCPANGGWHMSCQMSDQGAWRNKDDNALDLEADVFKLRSPVAVAASLKRSALRSRRCKASPYQSAVSMLNFYLNRAGKGLNPSRRRVLERAKG